MLQFQAQTIIDRDRRSVLYLAMGTRFSPRYRMLGQHLPSLCPVPVLALTATANPLVQRDIVTQLGLVEPTHFIYVFRRENIGIEIVETSPSQRPSLAREILIEAKHGPTIVYAPTRKQAESLAEEWAGEMKVASYHAGLDAERRQPGPGRISCPGSSMSWWQP